jgi:hypothetical protein
MNGTKPPGRRRPLAKDIFLLARVLSFLSLDDLSRLGQVCREFRQPVLVQFKSSLRAHGVHPRSKRVLFWAHRARVKDIFNGHILPKEQYLGCFPSEKRQGMAGLANTGTAGSILRDVPRTFPHLALQDENMLANVLSAVSTFCPGVGYCQGMNYVASMILIQARARYVIFLNLEFFLISFMMLSLRYF